MERPLYKGIFDTKIMFDFDKDRRNDK